MPPKYSVPTEDFPLLSGDGEILNLKLRGLSPTHVATLIRTQGDQMEMLFQKAKEGGELTAVDTETLIVQLLDEAPLLVGLVISFGIGEDDFWEDALDIPLADQVAMIEKIIALTFAREGGAKKVLGIIQSVINGMALPVLPKTSSK